ncbi:hypothetical protein SUGI_0760770 [Cryptomeria japonica]|uniref:ervatamin-B n=1 Tax=Cryptomeria japonica TaxID=3369 RepID=UPI002414C665|nr:ervatamin-B [Cryptomeria japonica]GLJ37444.1 hypothetical protein SUGI_0760770 [Cryptomeria japonica]
MAYHSFWIGVSIFVVLFTVGLSANTWSFSILGYEPSDHPHSEDSLLRLFQAWQTRHGKLYNSLDETAKRLNIFKRNVEYIHHHNRNTSAGHWLGLNKFADLTNEEFKALFSKKKTNPKRRSLGAMIKKAESCKIPASLDWREKGAVTGVKDQGNCGSCWSFSTTGAIEGVNAISTGKLVSLSEQELVDCDSTNYGCDGGSMDYAFQWVIQNKGIDTESSYPYTGTDGSCNIKKEAKKVVAIDSYTDVAESDSALLCAAAKQPISVGIDGSAWDFQLYSGGIYDGDCSSDPNDIDHAVLIVGYASQDGEDYWIVKNSWGTDWGIEGYSYIRRNTNKTYGVCAINAMASHPNKSATVLRPSRLIGPTSKL